MSKQREFEQPPEGHIGLLVYDSDTNKWYAVVGDSDGHIILEVVSVALPTGAATSAKQLADGHNVAVSNMISGFATEAKQLADGHNVAVSNMITGFATETKQLADGHNVTVDNADIEVVQPTAADLKMAQHQYDGAVWRKSNMLWGYAGRIRESEVSTSPNTTVEHIDFTVTASNEVWVITSISAINQTTVCDRIIMRTYDAGAYYNIIGFLEPAIMETLNWSGFVPCLNPEHVRVSFYGCGANDNIAATIRGYIMKLTM